MKRTIPAALIAILATTAFAGEPFTGTHTYRFDQQTWSPMPDAGWRTVTMVGDFTPVSGPIIASRIECRGANFWNGPIREADGVCVLGEGRDTWMLRYRMTRTDVASQTIDPFRRSGEWTVVGGTATASIIRATCCGCSNWS
ncbi:hypothetical protein [Roseomonas sp. HF4]|uniref:hypothetical protein n=1 Tax=Roseomonas sp. HF4 TaxID=2562313 RepID=UPI001F0F2FE9|nr:hypothetical protein [Roseomonas sp. HF4]